MFQQQVEKISFKEVKEYIQNNVLRKSHAFWPADYGHYGPLFVRLAWHCAGSYRMSDGRGGCDGGGIRLDPERSWPDNTNLDKARRLLYPVKAKFGPGLSWGDLFVMAGTAAIEDMGAPILGFCGGRVDAPDGRESLPMGPSAEQEALFPCDHSENECQASTHLGSIEPGAIYVNPGGVGGNPVPSISAGSVREVFARMDFNDSETVAICGGGHAFGKCHGACKTGPGPNPADAPFNSWPGTCMPKKRAEDTFTSGWEGAWTINPDKWDNNYFVNLVKYEWKLVQSPAGSNQWNVKGLRGQEPDPEKRLLAPDAHLEGEKQDVMMLTSDLAFMHDPMNKYQPIVEKFAKDQKALDDMFAYSWYKLMSRDMGPASRCVGDMVPPAQDWQFPLPSPPEKLADFDKVREALQLLIDIKKKKDAKMPGMLALLAIQCASTYRQTDHRGGCNGARIRFSPEKDWVGENRLGAEMINKALTVLGAIKEKFGDGLSWADLIVLAGNVALEDAGSLPLVFCGGRTDAKDGMGSKGLGPIKLNSSKLNILVYRARQMGLNEREYAALVGGKVAVMTGPLDNRVFKQVLESQELDLAESGPALGAEEVQALYADTALLDATVDYAGDNTMFLRMFVKAYTKMMNADRFDGPQRNLCTIPKTKFATNKDPCGKIKNKGRCKRRMCYWNQQQEMCVMKDQYKHLVYSRGETDTLFEEALISWYVVGPMVGIAALIATAYRFTSKTPEDEYIDIEKRSIMAA